MFFSYLLFTLYFLLAFMPPLLLLIRNIVSLILLMVEPSFCQELVITLSNAQAYLLPCNTGNLLHAFLSEVVMEAFIGTERVDSISHRMNIPIIHLQDIGKNLTAS